jgi:hypothetical protein
MQVVSELNKMGCDGFADVTAELALGVLTGRERAEALAHLDRCAACQENVRRLTVTGEGLVRLLPAVEPPPGFETRVLERLGLAARSPGPAGRMSPTGGRHFVREPGDSQPGRARRVLAAAAVTLAVAVSALGGWGVGAATSSTAGSSLRSAVLLSASHQMVGTIFLYGGGGRQWLSMSVDLRSGTRAVICQLVSRDGNVTALGSFWLNAGYGTWESPGPVGHGQFGGARLVSADGTILAAGSFLRLKPQL